MLKCVDASHHRALHAVVAVGGWFVWARGGVGCRPAVRRAILTSLKSILVCEINTMLSVAGAIQPGSFPSNPLL